MKTTIKNLVLFLTLVACSASNSQTWVQLNDIGTTITGTANSSPPVKEALSLSANGKIYVIGNNTFTGTTSSAVLWEYNPSGDSWAMKSNYPGNGTSYLSGFCIGNFLYVGFGSTGVQTANSDFYRYD